LSLQSFEVLHSTQRPVSQIGAPVCLAQSLTLLQAKQRPCGLQLGRSLAQSLAVGALGWFAFSDGGASWNLAKTAILTRQVGHATLVQVPTFTAGQAKQSDNQANERTHVHQQPRPEQGSR
jgi:hypothetical protein